MNNNIHCETHTDHMALHKQQRQEEQEFKRMIMSKVDKILENQAAQDLKSERVKLEQYRFCVKAQEEMMDNIEEYVDDSVSNSENLIADNIKGIDEKIECCKTKTEVNKNSISSLKGVFSILSDKVTRYEMYVLAFVTILGYLKYFN